MENRNRVCLKAVIDIRNGDSEVTLRSRRSSCSSVNNSCSSIEITEVEVVVFEFLKVVVVVVD